MVRKTREEALETRQRILDAAEEVFQSMGVSRTSLADIAAAAGVTRGAIYWHFANKVDLYDAMIQRVIEPLDAELAELQREPGDNPMLWLRALTLYLLDRVAADPRYQRVFEIAWHKCEYVGDMARIRDMHLECGNRYLAINRKAFTEARTRGYLRPEVSPQAAAVGLMALIDGLVVNWTLDSKLFPLPKLAPAIIDSYFAGLAPPPTRTARTATAKPAASPMKSSKSISKPR